MSKKRKRISRRRLPGQRVLATIPTHNLENGDTAVTAARSGFIAESGPAARNLLNVCARKRAHHGSFFFWGEKGLFSAKYAEEESTFLFLPCG